MSKQLLYKTWNDISISLYREINDIINTDLSEGEKEIAIIALLSGISEDEIYDMSISEVAEFQSQLHFLNDFSFNEGWKSKKITINGNEYEVQPDLTKFSYAQYVDFQTYWSMKDNIANMSNLLSVFIIPKGKKYNTDYEITDVINEIENHLPITVANSILFFFLKQSVSLIKALQISLDWKMKRMTTKKNKEKMQVVRQKIQEMFNQVFLGIC